MKNHQTVMQSLFTAEGDRIYVTTREIKRFLKQAEQRPEAEHLLCLVLAYTGCRITEALRLTVKSLDQQTECIVFRTLKQRQRVVYRQVPVPRFLIERLLLLSVKQNSPRLWHIHRGSAYRWVHNIMADANLFGVKASPKGLRHAFAIGCLEEDVPFPLVSKWMGHARLNTTAIYSQFVIGAQTKFAARRWSVLEA